MDRSRRIAVGILKSRVRCARAASCELRRAGAGAGLSRPNHHHNGRDLEGAINRLAGAQQAERAAGSRWNAEREVPT